MTLRPGSTTALLVWDESLRSSEMLPLLRVNGDNVTSLSVQKRSASERDTPDCFVSRRDHVRGRLPLRRPPWRLALWACPGHVTAEVGVEACERTGEAVMNRVFSLLSPSASRPQRLRPRAPAPRNWSRAPRPRSRRLACTSRVSSARTSRRATTTGSAPARAAR